MKRGIASRVLSVAALATVLVLFMSGCRMPWQKTPAESSSAAKESTGAESSSAHGAPQPDETTASESDIRVLELNGCAVASASAEASEAGMQILQAGGNAVDAAAAIAFALNVSEPYSSGIGGGGYMVVFLPDEGTAYSLDYYASAGLSETKRGEIAIPGLVKGMETALSEWGTISLAEALAPAITLAEEGFTASETFMRRLGYSDSLRNNPAFASAKTGTKIVQPALAGTLKTIRDEGVEVFYSGKIAEDICAATSLTMEDMASYRVYCEDAVTATFEDYTLYAASAPSSGITVLQMLSLAEKLDMATAEESTREYLAGLKIITEKAYASRSKTLADPRFYDFDPGYLLSEEYLDSLLDNTSAVPDTDAESMCTTEFSVIDRNGMIVCVTDTLSDSWGSYKLVDGFYLNNSLSVFGTTGKNAYAAEKRPRTHIAPVIAVGENGYEMAIGSPGGKEIPRAVAAVLFDILKGEDVETAVQKSRAMFDEDGRLCIESPDSAPSVINVREVSYPYYYSGSHIYFGCTGVVGYDPAKGFFAVGDTRRATAKGIVWSFED